MRRITDYLSLWHNLLFISLVIIAYLITAHLSEALSYSSNVLYFNQEYVQISWQPSEGPVDHYLLEVTDTQFLSANTGKSTLTSVKHLSSEIPFYQLKCEHNHSYQVRVKAVSPSGTSSAYSEASALFICDKKNPEISPTTLPSPQKVRSSNFSITGSFKEPNLSFILIKGKVSSINPVDLSFTATIKLEVGENVVDILAQDLAGNTTLKSLSINYAPLTILSLPTEAKLYWNGNYAYPGIYSGTTPRSYNQSGEGKQVIRLCYPGFNDYCGIIDFSDLSKDIYTIFLHPLSSIDFTQITPLRAEGKTIGPGTHSYPFVVDYDRDGRKDLLVGTQEGKIALFTNTGTEEIPSFSGYQFLKVEGKDIEVGTHAAPFMVDYNNDGTQDLLVGNGEGLLLYYANQGSKSKPVFTSPSVLKNAEGLDLAVDSYCMPCVVDWNEDHKKDLLLGSGNGRLTLYLNEGIDSDPLFASPLTIKIGEIDLELGTFAAPFVADWNGDGKKDLLVGDGEGSVHLYLNSGTEEEIQFSKGEKVYLNGQELSVEGFAVPFLVDWDHNGTKELLLGSGDGDIYLVSQ